MSEQDQSLPVETPEADAAEQFAGVNGGTAPEWPETVPFDADEADVMEQGRVVELDEDDDR